MVGAAVDGTRHVTHLLQSWTPRPQANTSPDPLLRFLFLCLAELHQGRGTAVRPPLGARTRHLRGLCPLRRPCHRHFTFLQRRGT